MYSRVGGLVRVLVVVVLLGGWRCEVIELGSDVIWISKHVERELIVNSIIRFSRLSWLGCDWV